MSEPSAEDRLLGHMLSSGRMITPAQLEEALAAVRSGQARSLKELVVARGWVSAETIDRANEASIVSPSTTAPTLGAPPATASTIGVPAPTSPTVGAPKTEATIEVSPGAAAPPVPSEHGTPPEVTEAARQERNRFGKYVLVKQLGAGGMAVVYKAWDSLLHHFVALKFIKTQDAAGVDDTAQEQIDVFLAEARLAVKLNHPNIARVYELGQHEDKYYMAQYFINGPTLHEVVHGTRGKSLETQFYSDPRKYISILRDVAEAMGYAHGLQPPVIHRDLKPSNIMLDSAGRAYVVDFGLAKELKVDGASMSGAVKGTPKYMAPEQAEGRSRDMDGRTDVWALGIILYEMLTGRTPFEDENIHRLLSKIVNDDPPWPRHLVQSGTVKLSPTTKGAAAIPRELEIIAMKCIQKDRRHRYASCKELVEDLDRALRGEQVSVPEHSLYWVAGRFARMMRRQRGLIAAALLGLAAAGVAAWALRGPGTGPERPLSPAASAALEAARARAEAARDAFLKSPGEETLAALKTTLASSGPAVAGPVREEIRHWFTAFMAARAADVRSLHGDGPGRPEWLRPDTRGRAEQLSADLALAATVLEHREALGLPDVDVASSALKLREILDWKGTFTVVADVRPWARVKVVVGGRPLPLDPGRHEDVTPLRLTGLPVGDVTLELERAGSARTVTLAASDLKDGAVLRLWGTLDKLGQSIE